MNPNGVAIFKNISKGSSVTNLIPIDRNDYNFKRILEDENSITAKTTAS